MMELYPQPFFVLSKDENGNKKCGKENRTGYPMKNYMVSSVREFDRYIKMRVRHNILLSERLRYPTTL
jgi:hypothetical protein